MVADQAHLHFIEYLWANLGNSNRRHWPHRTALRHIHQAALKWERKIKWIFRNDPDPNQWQLYIDTLGDYNPRYYRLIERTPTLAFLNIRKKSSLKELQGRSRMIKSAALSQWKLFMVDCYRKGKMTTYIRTILGEWKPQFTGAEIWCPLAGVFLTNQVDVLSRICDHMKTVYQAPIHHQGPIIHGTSE